MKFLIEDFGESSELDTFIYQLRKRFNPYYEVIFKLGRDESHKYFAYEDAARDYYNGLKKDILDDREYYDGANITLNKVTLQYDEDELEDELFYNDIEEDLTLEENLDRRLGLKK